MSRVWISAYLGALMLNGNNKNHICMFSFIKCLVVVLHCNSRRWISFVHLYNLNCSNTGHLACATSVVPVVYKLAVGNLR